MCVSGVPGDLWLGAQGDGECIQGLLRFQGQVEGAHGRRAASSGRGRVSTAGSYPGSSAITE